MDRKLEKTGKNKVCLHEFRHEHRDVIALYAQALKGHLSNGLPNTLGHKGRVQLETDFEANLA